MKADHLEVLVEELSMERTLSSLLPRLFPGLSFAVRTFSGKYDLLRKLPQRLRGYSSWLPGTNVVILVVVDRDADDCLDLKRHLDRMAIEAGLPLASSRSASEGRIINRIAVEELEAWFFGDNAAICAAYPRVSSTLSSQRRYRDPDAIGGGTWEAFEQVLQQAGYYKGGLPKVSAASEMARHLDPDRNMSVSFMHFRRGLKILVEGVS